MADIEHGGNPRRVQPTPDRIREVLDYDPETGWLVWRQHFHKHYVGNRAGSVNAEGYRKVQIDGVPCAEHRVAWAHFYGKWPELGLDHKDCDPANNRISNLREATTAQNVANVRRRRSNTSGYTGISWFRERGKWQAYIREEGRHRHLGLFDTIEEAIAVRRDAARRIYGEFARDD